MTDIPHRAWPLRRDEQGALAQLEQDELAEVQQSVAIIRATPLGARPLAPQIGVDEATFTAGTAAEILEQALEEQEDRAAVTVTLTPVDQSGEQEVEIAVGLAADRNRTDPDVV